MFISIHMCIFVYPGLKICIYQYIYTYIYTLYNEPFEQRMHFKEFVVVVVVPAHFPRRPKSIHGDFVVRYNLNRFVLVAKHPCGIGVDRSIHCAVKLHESGGQGMPIVALNDLK